MKYTINTNFYISFLITLTIFIIGCKATNNWETVGYSLDANNVSTNSIKSTMEFNKNFPKTRVCIKDSIYDAETSKAILDTIGSNWVIYEVDKENRIIKIKRDKN